MSNPSPRGARTAKSAFVLGALGVVFGDIGTSPLYALKTAMAIEGHLLIPDEIDVFGVVSLIFWSIMLMVVDPSLGSLVVPLGVVIIIILFVAQRYGTDVTGRLFGPIMVVWFVVLAALWLPHIIADPGILRALLPSYAVSFFIHHPFIAFVAMGAAVLSITGAEALYADMGHFGRAPIRRAWFWLVLPCLAINYLGQADQIIKHPESVKDPFFRLAPSWATIPLVVLATLATLATVIAAQSVISGAFSVSRQAERLGFLPRLTVRHTSAHSAGQIYVPFVNWTLCVGVLVLIVAFRDSEKLATASGLAVTATLLITTMLFGLYAAVRPAR